MKDYLQPEFYRFNQDSLELVRWVKQQVSKANSILDLGAGSGVIGLELAQHFRPKRLTLLELQAEYAPYLETNVQRFLPPESRSHLAFTSFKEWKPEFLFDLIVCNPPYYLPHAGQLSPDPRRAMARSFIRDNWEELLSCIARSLSLGGRAFLVVKNEDNIIRVVKQELCRRAWQASFAVSHELFLVELVRLHED